MTNLPVKSHAELGASVAARWMACPGSVQLSRGQPNIETEHSRAGTAAHKLAEMCFARGKEPALWVGEEIAGVMVDEEMAEAVKVFVDYCRALIRPADPSWPSPFMYHWIETTFNLDHLNPPAPMYGTADFIAYDPETKTLHVVDYKNGSGVVVEVVGNKQLRYYALGAALAVGTGLDIETVQMTIVQPRAYHPAGVVRHDHIRYVDLLDFADELLAAAKATQEPDAPLSPGPHCRFCPAAGICPAQRDYVQTIAQTEFAMMPVDVPPAPETLPPAILADILDKLPILEEWAKTVRAHAQRQLETGELTAEQLGQKLVEKRATRKWKNDDDVERFLRGKGYANEEIFVQKIKSPAQVEKLMGKDKKALPADFIVKESSGVVMVPLSDKREAVSLAAPDVFEALPAGE